MIRNLKEWRQWISEKGSSGEQVFDILDDWEEQITSIENLVKETLIKIKSQINELQQG